MMELSIKAPAAQAAVAVAGFMAFLAEVGAERDAQQKTKTRWALDYYVSKLPQDAAEPAIVKAVAPKRRVTTKAPGAAGGTTTPRRPRSPAGAVVPAKAVKPAAAPVPARRPAAQFRKRAAKRR